MTLFDAYLMVDWSASSRPNSGEDSIWIGVAVRDSGQVRLDKPENPRTRAAAELRVKQQLVAFSHQSTGRRIGQSISGLLLIREVSEPEEMMNHVEYI